MKKKRKFSTPSNRYSEAFKIAVVREFEKGFTSKDAIQEKYAIGGNSRVLAWCRIYGKLAYPIKGQRGRPMKDPEKQKIKDLEEALKLAHLKIKAYEKLIEVTERNEGIDIIKKDGAKQSPNFPKKKK